MKRIIIVAILFELIIASNAVAQWKMLNNGSFGGTIKSTLVKDKDIYIGTSCGVYLSTNKGENWVPKNQGLTSGIISKIVSNNEQMFLAISSGSVYISTDKGDFWVSISNADELSELQTLVVKDNNLFAGTTKGLYYSSNNGGLWIQKPIDSTLKDIKSLTVFGDSLYAGTNYGLYLSTDLGNTWIKKNMGITYPIVLCLTNINGLLWAGTEGDGLLVSTDKGENWIQFDLQIPYNFNTVNSISCLNDILYVATKNGVAISDDWGFNWESVTTGLFDAEVYSTAVIDNCVFAGIENNGVIVTSDKGKNWEAKINGLANINMLSIAIDGNTIYAGTEKSGLFKSIDYGKSWFKVKCNFSDGSIFSLLVKDKKLFLGSNGIKGLDITTDAGDSWNVITSEFKEDCVRDLKPFGNIIVAASNTGIYFSNSTYQNWTKSKNLTIPNISELAVNHPNVYITVGYGEIALTKNDGVNWIVKKTGFENQWINAIAVNDNDLFVGIEKGILLSNDEGENWTLLNPNTEMRYVSTIMAYGSNILVGTSDEGVFLSKDYGNTWAQINSGLCSRFINKFLIDGDNVFVATGNNGLLTAKLSDFGIVSVNEKAVPEDDISIYPNPVQNDINISFNEIVSQNSEIRIFDMLGQQVAGSRIPSGAKEWKLNLEGLPRGVYIVKVNDKIKRIIKL
ncbi:MAG: T9SS type A sorting domain-containing protein [bacterium]